MRLMLLISFLSLAACQNAPTIRDTEQCFVYLGETQDESFCGCRQYRFSEDYVGVVPGSQPVLHPLDYCHKLIGWRPDEYLEVTNYWGEVRRWIAQLLKRE